MALWGALSLNRNGENAKARNDRRADGVQKFSSVISECSAQKPYQPSSVMAMVPITAQSYIELVRTPHKNSPNPEPADAFVWAAPLDRVLPGEIRRQRRNLAKRPTTTRVLQRDTLRRVFNQLT